MIIRRSPTMANCWTDVYCAAVYLILFLTHFSCLRLAFFSLLSDARSQERKINNQTVGSIRPMVSFYFLLWQSRKLATITRYSYLWVANRSVNKTTLTGRREWRPVSKHQDSRARSIGKIMDNEWFLGGSIGIQLVTTIQIERNSIAIQIEWQMNRNFPRKPFDASISVWAIVPNRTSDDWHLVDSTFKEITGARLYNRYQDNKNCHTISCLFFFNVQHKSEINWLTTQQSRMNTKFWSQ